MLDALARDLTSGCRALWRSPGHSVLIVAILAGGIGAATAIFSIVNALLLRPLPYRDADRLVFVWQDLTQAGYPRAPLAGPELRDLRERSTLLTGFGGIWANTVSLTDGAEPEQLRIGLVTANFFDVLGANASLGRTFQESDEAHNAPPAILLSGALWKRRYGAKPDLVGSRILVNGRPTTVVGVMPEAFRLLLPPDSAIPDDQQAWLLLGRNALDGPRQQQFLRVVGRMKPGVRLEDAQREISAISQQVGREFPEYAPGGATFYALGLQAEATRDVKTALVGLFTAVSLLLTIACVNVAALLVTKAARRQHETAVRVAIGASRSRLFRLSLIEGLTLSVLGGAGGLLVGHALLNALLAARPPALARMDVTTLDARVFLFAVLVCLAWGTLFALAPLTQVFRAQPLTALRDGGRGAGTPSTHRLRAAMVVIQVAISSVLLVAAGLLAKGFYELHRVDAGFDETGVMTFKLSLAGTRHRGPQGVAVFSQQLQDRLRALPEVTGVGAISHLPYDTVPNWGGPYLPARETDVSRTGLADTRAVTPGYFPAVGAQLVEGRWFTDADAANAQPVAIVDTLLAARTWPGRSAVGEQLRADPGTTGSAAVTVTVVGVVRHLRHREITRDLREQLYFPARQSFRNPMAYAVRTTSDPASVVPAIRKVVADLDPALPVYDVRPLSAYTADARATRAFTFVLALVFAASALILAAVGVYGVSAYCAAQRRAEFGVRFALGARSSQVAGLVLRQAAVLSLGGAAVGSAGALVAAHLMRTQLYSVGPRYLPAYVAGLVIVLCATVAASWLPAYRAARTSPLDSLRLH